ncbi:MAG: hypothetical protein HY304_08585 [candidate division Zixibacteria bacterium]|nr:hypothetical protein [candidate division Zixibacteria bacterium]
MTSHRRTRRQTGNLIRQTVLYTGVLIVLPLLVYPRQFGFPAFELNPVLGLVEWGFYLVALSLLGLSAPFSSRVVAAGFTVVYRLATGTLLGTCIAWTHASPWGTTVAQMMWSYPWSLIPQILLFPVALRPVWEWMFGDSDEATVPLRSRTRGRAGRVLHTRVGPPPSRAATSAARVATAPSGLVAAKPLEPTLDEAVSYVGEYDGVRMCWIVDADGLPLAVWQKQEYTGDADFWVPVSVEMIDFHSRRLSDGAPCHPQRFEICTDQGRLMVEAVQEYWLGVLTDAETDDLVAIRLSRAREMISRCLHDISRRATGVTEVHYV